MRNLFLAPSGVLRIRWWPLAVVGAYVAYNIITVTHVALGGKFEAHPFWHAPLLWLFG